MEDRAQRHNHARQGGQGKYVAHFHLCVASNVIHIAFPQIHYANVLRCDPPEDKPKVKPEDKDDKPLTSDETKTILEEPKASPEASKRAEIK
jgi:hypothetical protein